MKWTLCNCEAQWKGSRLLQRTTVYYFEFCSVYNPNRYLQIPMKSVHIEIMIHRNCFPTPIMPPTLVRSVSGSIVRWDCFSTTSLAKWTNKPYLSVRASNPLFVVLNLKLLQEEKKIMQTVIIPDRFARWWAVMTDSSSPLVY